MEKIKCETAVISPDESLHILYIEATEENQGLFGSKIIDKQFEKIESVLSKRYIKLPFGIRILF